MYDPYPPDRPPASRTRDGDVKQEHVILYYAILYYIILYYTVLYCTILCCTTMWYDVF